MVWLAAYLDFRLALWDEEGGGKEAIMEAVVCPLGRYVSVELDILRQLTEW